MRSIFSLPLIVGGILLSLSACNVAIFSSHEIIPTQFSNGLSQDNQISNSYPSSDLNNIIHPYPTEGSSILPTLENGQLPPAPSDAPTPQEGKASISGTVFSYTSFIVIPDTTIYLTPAQGNKQELFPMLTGPNPQAGDIQGRTDSKGRLFINNVPPGNYFIIVWAPYSWSVVVDRSKDPPSPLLFSFEANRKYPLGVLQVSWP